jgi:hypothetical protein
MILQTTLWQLFVITTLLGSIGSMAFADSRLVDARAAVAQWVELEKNISRERLAWDEKKRLLEDMTAVAEAEIATIKEQLEDLSVAADESERRRIELVKKSDTHAGLSSSVKIALDSFEIRLKTLFPRLPKPLVDKLKMIMDRLPDDSTKTSLGIAARMQAVIAMITEIQRFDRVVTTGEELMNLSDGETREIYTIHFGLGASYFMTSDSAEGGVGIPAENGWQWESRPQLVPSIQRAIALASGNGVEAGFLSLPVATKQTQR